MCNINNYDLELVVNRLQDAIDVCRNVDSNITDDINDYDHSYPYATGYSRSAMEGAIETLMNDTKLWNKCRLAALKKSSNYSWEAVVSKIDKNYQSISDLK